MVQDWTNRRLWGHRRLCVVEQGWGETPPVVFGRFIILIVRGEKLRSSSVKPPNREAGSGAGSTGARGSDPRVEAPTEMHRLLISGVDPRSAEGGVDV